MPDFTLIASEIAQIAASLAGLILVFLGGVFSGFGSYEKTSRRAVVTNYRGRARSSFTCLLLSIVSLFLALAGKLLDSSLFAGLALMALTVAALWIASVAWEGVAEIKE